MLTWFAQEFFSSCVAACVRMVLNGLGDHRDEAEVRELIGYSRLGVSLARAQARLSEAGGRRNYTLIGTLLTCAMLCVPDNFR